MKDLFDFIVYIEKKHALMNWRIAEIFLWQAVRHIIFTEISERVGLKQPFTAGKEGMLLRKWIPKVDRFLYSVRWSCMRGRAEYDALVFEFVRKRMVNGEPIDIFTDDLVRELRSEKKCIQVIETPDGKYTKRPCVTTLGVYSFRAILGALTAIRRISPEDIQLARVIDKEIKENYGVDIQFRNKIRRYLFKFRRNAIEMEQLIRKRKPKAVYIVAKEPLSVFPACRKYGIPVIEMQHSLMSKYHIAYSVPDSKRIEYYPDKICVWGEHWKASAYFPIEGVEFAIYRNNYISERLAQYQQKEKKVNEIIVLSQWIFAENMLRFILAAAHKLEEYHFLFKLHPRNSGNFDRFNAIVQTHESRNVTVCRNERDLYDLLSEAEIQIGVFSTALIEGMFYECRTIILEFPGHELMDYWIENRFAVKVSSTEELVDAVTNAAAMAKVDKEKIFYGG